MLYVSFKHGTVDWEKDGRHFTDMTEDMLRNELKRFPQLHCLEVWVSEDVRPDRPGELWINALVSRGRPQ